MCKLATTYCDHMVKADIDGRRRNLRDEPNGHHDFVYGQTDVFPEHVERYLKDRNVFDAALYRERAVHLRGEYLHCARKSEYDYFDNLRPAEARFLLGLTSEIARDPFASEAEWSTAVLQLVARRSQCIITLLRGKEALKLTATEKQYFSAFAPREWGEYEAAIKGLSISVTGRRKHVAQSRRAMRKRIQLKGRALAKMLQQHGLSEFRDQMSASVVVAIAA